MLLIHSSIITHKTLLLRKKTRSPNDKLPETYLTTEKVHLHESAVEGTKNEDVRRKKIMQNCTTMSFIFVFR